jgi:hypothetical protein
MPAQSIFSELTTSLDLQVLGTYTPWASRTSDTTWEEITNPDTNIVLWGLNDDQIAAAMQLSYGSPLPFVAIITKGPMTQASIDAMWKGTAYKAYETQAVYRQDDAKPVPTIAFLHWGERIDMSQLPKHTLTIAPRAAAVGGALVFAAQIPSQGSTTRSTPATSSFQDALTAQMTIATPVTVPTGPPAAPPIKLVPTTPSVDTKTNLSLPIAVGLGAAVLGYMLWSKRAPRIGGSYTPASRQLARNRRR